MNADVLARISEGACVAFTDAWQRAITPRPKRRPSEWAEQERRMPIGGPVSGNRVVSYDHSFMPHCVEQMDAADDPSVRMIVIWEGVREGKTNGVCLNIMGRTVTDDPGGIFSVHPTDSDADKFSADDIEPMIELCPSLTGLFVAKKSRDPGRTKDFKKYRGGSLRIVSAGSITKFRGSTVKVLFLHEADALELESIYKALGRTQGLSDAVIVMESTGTLAPEIDAEGKKIHRSVIAEHYEKGDMRKWFCACESCGALQWLKYAQLRYPTTKGEVRRVPCNPRKPYHQIPLAAQMAIDKEMWEAARDDEGAKTEEIVTLGAPVMAETRYHCEQCDHPHDERAWRKMAAEGKWYPAAGLTEEQQRDIANTHHLAKPKQPEIRSYWRNGFTSLLPKSKGYATKLHQFVAEGEAAKASPEAFKTWTNEIAAELWSETSRGVEAPPWKPLFDRRENYGVRVPLGGLFLTCFVDCQLTRVEVGWYAWGWREESWQVDHVAIDGDIHQPDVWRHLRRELARRFVHELGCDLGLGFGLIDAGHFGEDVYRFVQDLARNPEPGVSGLIHASRGVGRHPHPVIDQRYVSISKQLKGHWIGTWQAKDLVYERLRMAPPEGWEERMQVGASVWEGDAREGLIHFNERFTEELARQCVVEKVTPAYEKGVEFNKYENPHQHRNEGLDILVGNLAAVRYRPRAWDMLEADLRERVAQAKSKTLVSPTAAIQRPMRNNSIVVAGW